MLKKKPQPKPTLVFTQPETELWVEVQDDNARPFMIMPRQAALAQHLIHQAVLVMVRNREGRVYIHRRLNAKKKFSGLWNVSSSGLVEAGESLEDAAMRTLVEDLGVTGLPLVHMATALPSHDTDWVRASLFVSAQANIMLNPDPLKTCEGIFVDEDELVALLRDIPEKLSPSLKWAVGTGVVFKR